MKSEINNYSKSFKIVHDWSDRIFTDDLSGQLLLVNGRNSWNEVRSSRRVHPQSCALSLSYLLYDSANKEDLDCR